MQMQRRMLSASALPFGLRWALITGLAALTPIALLLRGQPANSRFAAIVAPPA